MLKRIIDKINFEKNKENAKEELIGIINETGRELPLPVFNAIKENCYVAGGAITSTINNDPINDIDFWCTDKIALYKALDVIFKEQERVFNEGNKDKVVGRTLKITILDEGREVELIDGKLVVKDGGMDSDPFKVDDQVTEEDAYDKIGEYTYRVADFQIVAICNDIFDLKTDWMNNEFSFIKAISRTAVTFSNCMQLVMLTESIENQLAGFDFVHCRGAYDIKNDNIVLDYESYRAIREKILIFNNLEVKRDSPYITYRSRIAKFTLNGFVFDKDSVLMLKKLAIRKGVDYLSLII